MGQLPQIPVLVSANPAGSGVIYEGPAGAMGGGANFTVLLLARLNETLADVSGLRAIAASGDEATTGWFIYRPAGSDALAASVYNATGSATVTTGTLRGRGQHLICVMLVVQGTAVQLYINGTLVDSTTTAGGAPVDPGLTGLQLGSGSADPYAWSVAAFAYKDAALTAQQIAALTDSALAFGSAIPVGVGTSFNGNFPAGTPFWDYAYDAKDLVDPTAPGGATSTVGANVVTVTPPLALPSWPSAYARTANQPGQAAAPNAGVSLTAAFFSGFTGPLNGQLDQASLIWAQLDPPAAPAGPPGPA